MLITFAQAENFSLSEFAFSVLSTPFIFKYLKSSKFLHASSLTSLYLFHNNDRINILSLFVIFSFENFTIKLNAFHAYSLSFLSKLLSEESISLFFDTITSILLDLSN